MKLTVLEFLILPDQEQYEIVLTQGEYIDSIVEENKSFFLFAVDLFAPEVKNIVLLRTVKSMVEFKPIIGRGTRVYHDKDHFTITIL